MKTKLLIEIDSDGKHCGCCKWQYGAGFGTIKCRIFSDELDCDPCYRCPACLAAQKAASGDVEKLIADAEKLSRIAVIVQSYNRIFGDTNDTAGADAAIYAINQIINTGEAKNDTTI